MLRKRRPLFRIFVFLRTGVLLSNRIKRGIFIFFLVFIAGAALSSLINDMVEITFHVNATFCKQFLGVAPEGVLDVQSFLIAIVASNRAVVQGAQLMVT